MRPNFGFGRLSDDRINTSPKEFFTPVQPVFLVRNGPTIRLQPTPGNVVDFFRGTVAARLRRWLCLRESCRHSCNQTTLLPM